MVYLTTFTIKINQMRVNIPYMDPMGNGVYWGYNPLILTFDPNFQRDVLVGIHPQKTNMTGWKNTMFNRRYIFKRLLFPRIYNYLEDHLRTCKWLITMVSCCPLRIGLVWL